MEKRVELQELRFKMATVWVRKGIEVGVCYYADK
jgi:hypothetical protein